MRLLGKLEDGRPRAQGFLRMTGNGVVTEKDGQLGLQGPGRGRGERIGSQPLTVIDRYALTNHYWLGECTASLLPCHDLAALVITARDSSQVVCAQRWHSELYTNGFRLKETLIATIMIVSFALLRWRSIMLRT